MYWIVLQEDNESEGILRATFDTEQEAREFIEQEEGEYYREREIHDETGGLVEPKQPRLWIEEMESMPPLIF